MRVAIIGAGAAGLASARHVSAQGLQCEVYEMASELGGTWVYTDFIEKDQFGYPVHTSMYKDLRANLPKELMGFPDFPLPEHDESFLSQEDILHFLNLYADHFKLKKLIRFNEVITDVRPIEEKWQIKSIHKSSNEETVDIYDVVMVCCGNYHTPLLPKIPGEEKFKDTIIHSHHYRWADSYKDQRVLLIGAGPSAIDIAIQISPVARSVVISQHAPREIKIEYLSNVMKKPDIFRIKNEEEVEFVDGSCSSFDSIIHCTGYRYDFPFLHDSCGVTIEEKHLWPLYKHIINIERASMCFIGVPTYCCAFFMFDLQARFYCQYLNGSMVLPSRDDMFEDIRRDIEKRRNKGLSKQLNHVLGFDQQEYYDDLAAMARISSIAPVFCKIWDEWYEIFFEDLQNYRNYKARVLNNDSFVKIPCNLN